MGQRNPAALLTTSAKTDVKRSGGKLSVTGLKTVRLSDLIEVEHRLYRAEVAQVYTIGGTTDPTITASTQYILRIGYPYLDGSEGSQLHVVKVAHTTPATLSGVAATDRQNVYDALAAKINDNSALKVTADPGTGGTAMTITDDGDYFANRPNAPRGASVVKMSPDPSGGGFEESVHLELTTAAVYQFGEGTRLAEDDPSTDPVTGNLVSGEFDAPSTTAVAGQQYDGFYISTFKRINYSIVTGQQSLAIERQLVYVDDGAGTSTSNAAGYAAFRTEMERVIYGYVYGSDPNSMVTFLDSPPTYAQKQLANGTVTTGLPTGAAGDENTIAFANDGVTFEHHVLGTQTILIPKWDTSGLLLNQDLTANDGLEISASIESASPVEYVVGTDECSFAIELTVSDITDLNPFAVGFRKKEAFQADYNDYDELAGFAIQDAAGVAKDIYIHTILNNAATAADDTGVDWADDETRLFEVKVDIDGNVSFFIDEVEYTDQQTTAMVFDSGEVIIPFCNVINEAGDHGLVASKWLSIPAVLNK